MKAIIFSRLRVAWLSLTILLIMAGIVGNWLTPASQLSALTGHDFSAGHIIDDSIFTNSNAISAATIQNFLNAQLPTCDTNGTTSKSYYYNSSTGEINNSASGSWVTTSRLIYGQRYATWNNAHPPSGNYIANESVGPYVCLKNYVENPSTGANNLQNPSASISGGQSAAQIIFNAGQQYGINPEVLVTTLQKEQGLVTDDWPWTNEYIHAMGYNCTDSAPCSGYAGFYQQMNAAARQFRNYLNNPNNYNYVVGSNKVAYSPSCAGPTITILNQATAALYDYTPYQPDPAVLAATNPIGSSSGPGGSVSGDYCDASHTKRQDAYGNRNFWWYFNTWFGPSTSFTSAIPVTNIQQPDLSPARGETITYRFSLTNTFSIPLTFDGVGAVGRLGSVSGSNRDLGWQGPVTLQPGATQQFTFTMTLHDTGTLYVWPTVLYQGTYQQYNNWGSTLNIHSPNLTLSQPLVTSSPTIYSGQDVTFSATVQNNEPQPINYDAMGIPVRFNGSTNLDAVWVGPGTIGAGQTLVLSGTRHIDQAGPYTYWVADYFGGSYTTLGSVKQTTALPLAPNFSVTGLNFPNSSAVEGQTLSTTFSVTNNLPLGIDIDALGIVGRLGTFNGANRDLGWQGPVHFNAGQTQSFTISGVIPEVGTHYYWIGALFKGTYYQYNNWGSTIVGVHPNFSVTGMNFSSTSPAAGSNLSSTFSITNNLSIPIDVDAVGVVGRLGTINGPNRDLGWQSTVHFNAGQTQSFTISGTIPEAGTHYYWIGILYRGTFYQYNNWGSTIVSH